MCFSNDPHAVIKEEEEKNSKMEKWRVQNNFTSCHGYNKKIALALPAEGSRVCVCLHACKINTCFTFVLKRKKELQKERENVMYLYQKKYLLFYLVMSREAMQYKNDSSLSLFFSC